MNFCQTHESLLSLSDCQIRLASNNEDFAEYQREIFIVKYYFRGKSLSAFNPTHFFELHRARIVDKKKRKKRT